MRVVQLRIRGLRNLSEVELELSAGINVLVGSNGAGKTSVLEAVFLMAHAQSFRGGSAESLVFRGGGRLEVFVELMRQDGRIRRVGLMREGARWVGRVDGRALRGISELLSECAVVSFDPGSHALIGAGAEVRRRFLDWSVFHVEPEFYGISQSYRRALRQRNALLKASGSEDELAAWDEELVRWADRVHELRSRYLAVWEPTVVGRAEELLGELGSATLSYARGWKSGVSLMEALEADRGRDRRRGFSHSGPHRADWSLVFEGAPGREFLSRGQEKLCALACAMSQATVYAELTGEWPIVCFDDLASELDLAHRQRAVKWLQASGAQVLISGTDCPSELLGACTLFHVEQGRIDTLL
ncbi:MAG: DNA replication/repair protein RecF [Tahibacter sp.]